MKKFFAFCFVSAFFLLALSSLANPMPKVGQMAPNFFLPDQNGKLHRLSDYKGKIVVLAFYPADFTKGCTLEAHVNSHYYPQYKKEGIVLLGISVQTPKSHKAFCETEGISYTLLADTQGKVASLYGVFEKANMEASKISPQAWYAHPKKSAFLYAKDNPHPIQGYAKRVTFIIGKSGKIAYIDPDVNQHLLTCAKDWLSWINAHKALLEK
jgi:peroxiredoxin Q/BCP